MKTHTPLTFWKVAALLAGCLLLQGGFAKAPAHEAHFDLHLPAVDVQKALAEDLDKQMQGQPLRYAVTSKFEPVQLTGNKASAGHWEQLPDGGWQWLFHLDTENATSIDLGFENLFLPHGARLEILDQKGARVKGPYTDANNRPHKQLWPGPVIGKALTVRLRVPEKMRPFVQFTLAHITRGYKKFWEENTGGLNKSGSCNVDVACPEGDGWQNPIKSVARYVRSGQFLCTGQLINNTSSDGTPFFLTADHCGFNASNAASINLWWNYESPTCRAPGSASSGTPISTSGFNDTQSGATFIASNATSDFALLRLDTAPPQSYDVFYTGWDRRDQAPSSAVAIHHPAGHAKRISFENDPLSITGYSQSVTGNASHLRVADWDLGTTEGGSSGSGLWTSEQLLVGQLHGGLAACGNDDPDWYGRFSVSWDNGTTPQTRLKDWLDPINTGAQTLQGQGACTPPAVSMNIGSGLYNVDETIALSASATGGAGGYIFHWDLNGDGLTDATGDNTQTRFQQAYTGNVTLTVTDSSGCQATATQAIVVQAPVIAISSTGALEQVCGNNDNVIDPGERWKLPVTLKNNGSVSATDAWAVFAKQAFSTTFTDTDGFGNAMASCSYNFVDISGTGTSLAFIDPNPNDTIPAEDDGATVAINLPVPFNFYGQTYNQVVMSSNGYLSLDDREDGSDYDNDCPLPQAPNRGGNQGRILPMHDDLIVNGGAWYQHFNSCPRPAETGGTACDVFQWNDVASYANPNLSMKFQAILYPATGQWVFQYATNGTDNASVGLLNPGATDALNWSCNGVGSITAGQAVCAYYKDNKPGALLTDKLFLETPAVALGNMPAGAQNSTELIFSTAYDAVCGANFAIAHEATVFDEGFNTGTAAPLLSTTLGNNGVCNVANTCNANDGTPFEFDTGLWWNPRRSGNGNDMHQFSGKLVFLEYTANAAHDPVWYITTLGALQNGQARTTLIHKSYPAGFVTDTSAQINRVAGEALTTFIDATHAIQTRTIDGNFSAEKIQRQIVSNTPPPAQYTGIWWNPAESGWGTSIETQGDATVFTHYLYDDAGQPYWLQGVTTTVANPIEVTLNRFRVHCPHCPWVPLQATGAGNLRMRFDSTTSGEIENMSTSVDANGQQVNWQRNNLEQVLQTPPKN